MSKRHGRPVTHRLVPFPPRTVSGLWVATDTRHLILCEANTVPDHQLVILGHEFWHLEAHQANPAALDITEASRLFAPNLDAAVVERVATRVAARTDYCEDEETEAELFGSLLGAKARRRLPSDRIVDPAGGVPESAVALVRRLEVSLANRPQAPGHE
ncbi:hypothetical protein [Streptomyces sp. URMC 123]|uniref:hypothetical protein n=1 Tax=Streptomyces sp. URMC 123 TaxID=3423403 RepID=UPI003F1AF5C6